MEKVCSKCNENLVKGLATRLLTGALSVRFDKKVKEFEKINEPIISPYVCKKCGFVEWYIDRIDLL